MNKKHIFKFESDISKIDIPTKLNNPFGLDTPEIAKIAATEFQEFINLECLKWKYDFATQKGKMIGVLVVQKEDNSLGYLGTVSGKLPGNAICSNFVPSVFDASSDDFFINKGMVELTEISNKIKKVFDQSEINDLKEYRKQKSFVLQKRLFENYRFLNIHGVDKNVIEIFKISSHNNPPSAAGECTAPKLLQNALKNQLKPIAIAEFWWGNTPQNKEKVHKAFYPACKNRCRPILEFMLDDKGLFDLSSVGFLKVK